MSSIFASQESALSAFISNYGTGLPAITPFGEPIVCAPFTMLQGPETWEFHLTVPGVSTRNGACTWTGVFTEVPITCDADAFGEGYSLPSGTPTVFSQSELRQFTELRFAVATIVEATPTSTPTSTPTPASAGDASGPGETGTKATGSQGRAPSASLPTGAMLVIGGAAAIAGAAWGF